VCVCVFYSVPFEGWGVFYFEIEIDETSEHNITDQNNYTRTLNNGSLNVNIAFNCLETMQMSRQQPEYICTTIRG